ncbi:MAG: helicase, partial [Myxococcales bacterium]|nr:helicase [Myxococcales bacterium]
QLAFVLLNVVGVTDDAHADRAAVELIFFPTGGGKTEAYLGVIAFALVLRRLRGHGRPDAGLGVTVILRYTLRLLTLDQLGRAATLVCALEKQRREAPSTLGDVRFGIGLWVGTSATANTLAALARQVTDYKNNRGAELPCPLPACPWCGSAFNAQSFRLLPSTSAPERLVLSCSNHRCDFSDARHADGLPVVYVDEQIYRELPSFLIGTVDKFALLPYRAQAGMLFGRVTARSGGRFFGTATEAVRDGAVSLPDRLQPPELIVQDELHLISGPLGTMVGLYETAVDHLCQVVTPDGRTRRPKLLASTATVRRADRHVRALFARDRLRVFPPPGIDENETWFSVVDRAVPGRLYAGVAAAGRPTKNILLRTYSALLAGAQKQWLPGVEDQPADSYMTLVGYFNSLRELGGMRRLVEDEARVRCASASRRVPEAHTGAHPWFADRDLATEPAELTSRESTARIAATKARLEKSFALKEHVDVVLASNMISVGVDIDRLGLMVVAGQPKTTSEYIQASSRVGRRDDRPGLVVTCYNLHRPRDRSHYEGFVAFHRSFYRFVEPTSLTPFSAPALQRGFAGALIAMIRHGEAELMPAGAVHRIPAARARIAARALTAVANRAAAAGDAKGADLLRKAVVARGENLLDRLEVLLREAVEGGATRTYTVLDRDGRGRPIMSTGIDETDDRSPDERAFTAPMSMRDVEPSVHVWVYRRELKREVADGDA